MPPRRRRRNSLPLPSWRRSTTARGNAALLLGLERAAMRPDAKSRCTFEVVGRATGASCANRARLGSSLCERNPLPMVALESTGDYYEGDGPNGWPDLTERSAALTRTAYYMRTNSDGYGASENEQLFYEKWSMVAWRASHALGKTLSVINICRQGYLRIKKIL